MKLRRFRDPPPPAYTWEMKPLLTAFILTAALSACASDTSTAGKGAAPLSAITDPKAHTGAQTKAIRRAWDAADAGEITRAEARELLKKTAWARSRFYEVRLAALEELLKDEANLEDTRNMMRLMLPTETQWNVIRFLGDTAADRGWTDLTTALVRCWSRPVAEPTDDKRPEREALARLHPGRAVEDVVFGVFAGEPGLGPQRRGMADSREREQQEAWALLRRIDHRGERTVALLAMPPSPDEDETLSTLRIAARDLHVVPDSPEQLAWLTRLRSKEHAETWNECVAAVSRLNEEAKRGLELRHVLGIRWAATNRPEWSKATREELHSTLSHVLEPRKRYIRAQAATASRRAPESLRSWSDGMSWGDFLLCLIAAEAAMDPGLAKVIFAQAEDDRRDTSTEYGGVIDGIPGGSAGPGGFAVRLFPPRPAQRYGDRRFVASPEMIEQGTTSIFHYHLHCTSYDNADYAGPSADDIAYAKRQGRSCLVFTFVNRDALNVDYFQPDGATIDLGTVRRTE